MTLKLSTAGNNKPFENAPEGVLRAILNPEGPDANTENQ